MKNDGRNLIQNGHRRWLWFNPEIKGVLVGQNQQNQYVVHKPLKQIFREITQLKLIWLELKLH